MCISATTTIKIDESCGHTVDETIVNSVSVSPFDNLTMNGFTVYHTNLVNVFEKIFVILKVGGKATMRDIPSAGDGKNL